MGCSRVDLKAYALGETDQREKGLVEGHVAGCTDCREELDRLRFTHTALAACAILAHGWMRPVVASSPGVDQAKIERRIQDEVARRVDSAVATAVAASEQRQSQETARMLAAAE